MIVYTLLLDTPLTILECALKCYYHSKCESNSNSWSFLCIYVHKVTMQILIIHNDSV